MGGIIKYYIQRTRGRGPVSVNSFFQIKSWDVNLGWEIPVN